MGKEFDFDDIGKKMPYKVPGSFFDENRSEIFRQTCGEERRKKSHLKLLIPAVFLATAILTGLLFIPFAPQEGSVVEETVPASAFILAAGTESTGSETMDAFIENLSDEELQELAEQSDNDIFLF